MRSFIPFFIAASLLLAASARAEDAADLETKGIAALKLSQNDADAIVPAAMYFGQASDLYQAAKNDDKATEMNSFLYWCKKKMTLQQMDEFLKGGSAINAAVAKRMKELEAAPPPDEAQTYFNRAEDYANAHPAEHLLIAVRFYEVADRFKGTELSLQAQDRSLKEMTLEKTSVANTGTGAHESLPPLPQLAVNNEGKMVIPDAATLKKVSAEIHDLFKDDYAKNSDGLAAKFFAQAEASREKPNDRYVLLKEAAQLAAQKGDARLVTNAVNALTAAFQVEPIALKLDLLQKCSAVAATGERADALAAASSDLITEAAACDQYDVALKALAISDGAARKAQDNALVARLKDRAAEIRDVQAEFSKVKLSREVLLKRPEDPDANFAYGSFLCFAKGDWQRGLPFLAHGRDEKLKTVALKDLSNSQDAEQLAELGNGWFEIAEKLPQTKRRLLNAKIYQIYSAAYARTEGVARLKLEKRLQSMSPPALTMVVWNCHNSTANDRGTTEFKVILIDGASKVWSSPGNIQIDWKADEDTSTSVILPPLQFSKIRIEITQSYKNGAGLSEVELMKNGTNLALGCAVTANSIFDKNPKFAPTNLTDGITTSKNFGKGYWITHWTQTGWVEIDLTQKASGARK